MVDRQVDRGLRRGGGRLSRAGIGLSGAALVIAAGAVSLLAGLAMAHGVCGNEGRGEPGPGSVADDFCRADWSGVWLGTLLSTPPLLILTGTAIAVVQASWRPLLITAAGAVGAFLLLGLTPFALPR